MQKNMVRSLLKEYFSQRKCFTFVQPHSEEHKLQILNQLPFSSLRKEFREQVLSFRRTLFSQLKAKRINNKDINGHAMADLLLNYIAAINHGAVPNIENAFSQVSKYENDRLLQQSVVLYENSMNEQLVNKLPVDSA